MDSWWTVHILDRFLQCKDPFFLCLCPLIVVFEYLRVQRNEMNVQGGITTLRRIGVEVEDGFLRKNKPREILKEMPKGK